MAIVVRNEGAKVNSNINVTPMVDVMLVLLIIFMVITPMLQKGVPVDLAKTTTRCRCRMRTRKMLSSWLFSAMGKSFLIPAGRPGRTYQ